MRKILLTVFLCLGAALFAQENLVWSMALLKEGAGVPFSQPVRMKDGDRLNIAIISEQGCYAYVVLYDAEGQTTVFLNKRLAAGETWQTGPLRLTPPSGTETFYVVMSRTEQPELKTAIEAQEKESNTRTRRNLTTAITELRRSASQFRENPEKPVNMGGSFRGEETGGTEFSGAGAYVKIIVINH